MTTLSAEYATGVTSQSLANVRRWNIALTVLHLGQALAMLALTNDFSLKVLSSFPDGPPGTDGLVTKTLFDVRVGWVIGAFLLLAGIDHFLTATIARTAYEKDLRRGIKSISLVRVLHQCIAHGVHHQYVLGILTLAGLIAVVGANISMILFGWLQEKTNPPGRMSTTMVPFWFGAFAGITPWLAMGVNVSQVSADDAPSALFVILIVQAVFFFCFGLNQWLQYRGIGKWKSYMFGEKTYLVLSLGAKSLLAWQIFAVSLVA